MPGKADGLDQGDTGGWCPNWRLNTEPLPQDTALIVYLNEAALFSLGDNQELRPP